MRSASPSSADEVDQILLNARLRDELEPFRDESLDVVDLTRMTTTMENEFLASLLAWERAPVLPISQWFQPEMKLPPPETLDDEQLRTRLFETIHRLYEQRIVLEFTEHLSDRQLYCVLYRDILPAAEKKLDPRMDYLRWHCLDPDDDPETWLRYYASDLEREEWAFETGERLPPSDPPPFPRKLPRRPL